MSGATEVDTYGQLQKAGAGDGGFRIMGFCDGTADVMQIMGFSNGAQNSDTTGSGATVELFGAKKSGTSLADLASDELTGGYDIVKGERIKIKGYLEDFALSKNEADELIMSARKKIYKD